MDRANATQAAETKTPPRGDEPVSSRDEEVFATFRSQIDAALDAHIPRGRPAALLQFPYDANVGNHMMWVATTDYLRARQIPVGYVAHGSNFDVAALRRAIGRGPILFLGGVTISRLWPRHGEVKRLVAEALPDNPLISLPATSLLVDDADRQQAGALFGRHANVTVMARDPESGAQARAAFPSSVNVVTVPDLALRLAAQPRRATATFDIMWLRRGDTEAKAADPPSGVHVFDWPEPVKAISSSYVLLRASGLFSRLRSSRPGDAAAGLVNPPMAWLYRRASLEALRYGNTTLDRGTVLVTDRMHPHVLAALRGQHVVLLPDRFGKNRAVYDFGTHRLNTVHWADTPAQALDIARTLAAQQPH